MPVSVVFRRDAQIRLNPHDMPLDNSLPYVTLQLFRLQILGDFTQCDKIMGDTGRDHLSDDMDAARELLLQIDRTDKQN